MTDHSEMIGLTSLATDKSSTFYNSELAGWIRGGRGLCSRRWDDHAGERVCWWEC